MAIQDIVSYLRENSRFSREQLREKLKQGGYTAVNIAMAEQEIDGGPPPPPPPPDLIVAASAVQVKTGVRMLHPRAVWKMFIRLFFTWFLFGIYVAAQLTPFFLSEEGSFVAMLVIFIIIFLLITVTGSYFWAKLSYRMYKYELTERGFKKELGVIRKKYVTIPYDRIQNIDMSRSIIDRVLGLTSVHLQTAGRSGHTGGMSFGLGGNAEGIIPGLSHEDAEALREEVMYHVEHASGRGI